jgi:hypothetical protein
MVCLSIFPNEYRVRVCLAINSVSRSCVSRSLGVLFLCFLMFLNHYRLLIYVFELVFMCFSKCVCGALFFLTSGETSFHVDPILSK